MHGVSGRTWQPADERAAARGRPHTSPCLAHSRALRALADVAGNLAHRGRLLLCAGACVRCRQAGSHRVWGAGSPPPRAWQGLPPPTADCPHDRPPTPQGFEKTGLGERVANLFVRLFGRSTLGEGLPGGRPQGAEYEAARRVPGWAHAWRRAGALLGLELRVCCSAGALACLACWPSSGGAHPATPALPSPLSPALSSRPGLRLIRSRGAGGPGHAVFHRARRRHLHAHHRQPVAWRGVAAQ